MARVGPAETIRDAKKSSSSSPNNKNDKIITESCRFQNCPRSLQHVMRLISSSCVHSKDFSMATIDSSGQNLSDEQNLLNEVHLVIAFIGNPTWIKERKEGTYLLSRTGAQMCYCCNVPLQRPYVFVQANACVFVNVSKRTTDAGNVAQRTFPRKEHRDFMSGTCCEQSCVYK